MLLVVYNTVLVTRLAVFSFIQIFKIKSIWVHHVGKQN